MQKCKWIRERLALVAMTVVFVLFAGRIGEWSNGFDSQFLVYGQTGGTGTGGTGGTGGTSTPPTKIVPHIAFGNFGSLYTTVIQIINTNSTAVTVTGNFYTQAGTPSTATYTTNLTSTPTFTGTLTNASVAANSVLVISVAGANNPTVFDGAVNWGKFTTSGNVTISSFYEIREFSGRLLGRVGLASSLANLSNFVIPRFRNAATGSDTGFAIANTGSSSANITMTLRDSSGTTLAARTISLAANSQTAQFLATFLNGTGCAPCLGTETGSTTRYHYIKFTSTSAQFGAIGLGIEGDISASFPVEAAN